MARTEKKTRIRKLPARLQLTEIQSLTGSYPMIARGAIVDNRTGMYGTPYVDSTTTTIFAATSSAPEMNYTSSLSGVAYRPGQDLQPFRDFDQFAVEGKSTSDPFWASGSNLPGFQGPLWSKNKIEIDLTPSAQSAITATLSDDYGARFNFTTRLWQSDGSFVPGDVVTLPDSYEEVGYQFTPSYHSHVSTYDIRTRGKPISNFGFPNIINTPAVCQFHMSGVINRPFIVEKIYVEISASYIKGSGPPGATPSTVPDLWLDAVAYDNSMLYGGAPRFADQVSNSYVVNNFYILNDRGNISKKDLNNVFSKELSGDPIYYYFKPFFNQNTYKGNDLVTWFEIASFNDNYGYVTESISNPGKFYRDVTIVDSSSKDPFFSSWSKMLKMSGAVRVPNSSDINDPNIATVFDYSGLASYFLAAGWFGGRNGLGGIQPNGRDLIRGKTSVRLTAPLTESYTESPYLLLPTDKLSFNWQMPIPETDNSFVFNPGTPYLTSSLLVFAAKPAKVVLYGSYLSEDNVENPTLNQLLSSDSIHEAIE